jgi:hypothetical protein
MGRVLLTAATVVASLLLTLLVAEAVLRLLPVRTSLRAVAVDDEAPVFHFGPGRAFTFSAGWNFAMLNRGRVNNAGFVNDQDYHEAGLRPLLAVVGDSFVEAAMVPYAQTLQGRLAAAMGSRGRVYSFAASGAPLSQYLAWAQHARAAYGADAIAIVVVGNDFDESLAAVKRGPGFHHYVDEGGTLVLHRFDYRPSRLHKMAGHSALMRYLMLNLHADALLRGSARKGDFVGNTDARAEPRRVAQSNRAVDAFLRDLAGTVDLPPERIAFVVDGLRYAEVDPGHDSYFARMRASFIAKARAAGHEVVDMDETFLTHRGERFDWPTDGHWNGRGHELAAEALMRTRLWRELTSAWSDRQ